jgi:hypothetical protein
MTDPEGAKAATPVDSARADAQNGAREDQRAVERELEEEMT